MIFSSYFPFISLVMFKGFFKYKLDILSSKNSCRLGLYSFLKAPQFSSSPILKVNSFSLLEFVTASVIRILSYYHVNQSQENILCSFKALC